MDVTTLKARLVSLGYSPIGWTVEQCDEVLNWHQMKRDEIFQLMEDSLASVKKAHALTFALQESQHEILSQIKADKAQQEVDNARDASLHS